MSTLSSHRRYRVNTPSNVGHKSQNNVLKLLSRHKFRRNNKLSPLVMSQSNWDLTNLKTNDFSVCPTIDRYKQLKWKVFLVNAKLPDGSWRQLIGKNSQTVFQLVNPIVKELSIKAPVIRLLESEVLLDGEELATLIEGEDISVSNQIVDSNDIIDNENETRLQILEKILVSEREFQRTIRSVKSIYEKPLKKLLCITNEEHRLLFDWTEPLISISSLLQLKLQKALTSWDSQTCVGPIFSKQFWIQYEEYLTNFPNILSLLEDKQQKEDEFVVICRLRKGAAKHSLYDLLHIPLDRISQYDKYLTQLVNKTNRDHQDYTDLCRSANKAKTMVKRTDTRQEESDLDRIQELFPSDNLRLHETDPLSPRKGLLRSKSLAASRLHRALSGKSSKTELQNSHSIETDGTNKRKLDNNSDNCIHRYFVMDGPVVFTIGVQSQERHLFLFNDLMLIAKSRSSGNYKLKEKVRVSEMWLSKTSLEDVCEATKSPLTSFVIGWPTNNVVATFSSPQSKELWHERIQESINKVKEKEGKSNTTIQVSYWDQLANEEKYTLLKVTNRDTTREAIKSALNEFKCDGPIDHYQLWVKTSRDDTPYPLIGHEYPFAIKMNFVRDLLHRSNLDLQNFNNIAADNKCIFILRKSYPKSNGALLDNSAKKSKTKRRPINWPFKKIGIKADLSIDSGICSEPSTPTKPNKLFGQHLDLLCNEKQLPKPLMNMLKELFVKGPFTIGIFRKSANARVCKEFRAKLESDPNTNVSDIPVIVIASVFKEFLRSLPDCILQSKHYPKWIEAISTGNNLDCRERVQHLLDSLPEANLIVLRHFLCALWHISQQSPLNKMCSVNLGVCVGQSLLSPNPFANPNPVPPTSQRCEEMSKQVPKLIAYLIDHCPDLLGEHTLRLLGNSPTLADKDIHSRQDSGAEESDSLNSLPDNGVGSNTSSGGNRCDDSSIDSLERALMDDNSRVSPNSPPHSSVTFANKMSLSNLSHDSGLTLSDTQLYTPDDDECDSDQFNSGYSQQRKCSPLVYPYLAKSVPHLDQTGLESDINVTFSYGRSVGVSIDGSCHDVVMRKRRHQAIGQNHDFPHIITRQSRNGHHSIGSHNTSTYGHNNNHYRHNHNYRQPVLSPQHSSSHYHHYSHSAGQHIPIHYSKSYSYGINGDDLNDSREHLNGGDDHREYRYRRPPLAAVLGGAPISSAHTFHNQMSAQCLRRSNSEESLVRSYNGADNELNGYSAMSMTYTPTVHQSQQWLQQTNNSGHCSQYNPSSAVQNHYSNNSSATKVTLRADVHHYENACQQRNTVPTTRVVRQESIGMANKSQQQMMSDRVGSICSSSSETASNRSTLSKQSSNVSSKRSSSSLRSSGGLSFPPTYQEAMNRKERLCRAQSNTAINSMTLRKTSSASTTSTNSNQIYEESVRIYNSDLDNKNNVTHRAVPVRVNGNATDSDNSDIENIQLIRHKMSAHKQVVRAASDGLPLLVNGSAGARVVRISAQNNLQSMSAQHNSLYHSSLSSSTAPVVSVLQRSAKDFTPEEWKKDINCNNVATLRKLFTSSQQSSAQQSSQPQSPSCHHSSNCETNTYNIYVGRPTVRPTSVLIENNTNNNNNNTIKTSKTSLYKLRPNSIQETTSAHTFTDNTYDSFKSKSGQEFQSSSGGASKGVTVVHVGQTDINCNKAQVITVHKRSDSVGNSSDEESYV